MKTFKKLIHFLVLLYFFSVPLSTEASTSITNWTNTTSLPIQTASHISFTHGDRIFVIGGANSSAVKLSHSSAIGQNGMLSGWEPSSVQSPPILWHSAGQFKNYIYLLGGATFLLNSASNTIYVGEIENSGNIPSWDLVNPLPKSLSRGESIIIGNNLYYAGGEDEFGVKNQEVYVSSINNDGTLNPWIIAGLLPYPLDGFSMVNVNNSLIIIGGNTNNGFSTNVWKSNMNIDGTLQLWTPLPSLPDPVYRGGATIISDTIVVVGGISTNGVITDNVYFADLDINGNYSSWQKSQNSLPRINCCSPLSSWNNYIYLTGGHDGSYYSDVLMAKITKDSEIDLPVTLLKQTSEPWQSKIYDSANSWSPTNPTINRWGCALTSVAMILNYYGLTKMSSSVELNPDTLNTWLTTQNDGYIRNGLINWLAVSRLSKNIKIFNPSFQFDALEYRKINGIDKTLLDDDLASNIPVILEEPGHFIVAKGKTTTSYKINDPFYTRSLLTEGYNNSYISIRQYIPSNTDLSYILVEVNPEIQIILKDGSQQSLGEEYLQQPITDPLAAVTSGESVRMLELSKPRSGVYSISLLGDNLTPYILNVYLYDKFGNVKKINFSDLLTTGINELTLDFSKDDSNNSNVYETVSFSSILNNIKFAEESGSINHRTAVLLRMTISNAEKDYELGKKDHAVKQINLFKEITLNYKKNEENKTLQKIINELELLKNFILTR